MPLPMLTIARLCNTQKHFKLGSKRAVKQPRENGGCKMPLEQNKTKTRKEKKKKNPLGCGPEGTPRARLVEVAITEGVLQERA